MADRVLGGRYTIQDRIGTGGMAVVYRGIDNVLGRTVAIKTMLPQYASDPSFAARFKQEAQAAAALQSPYIVSVYDWGRDGDTYYIAMEYLRGTDLKSGIRNHEALDCRKVAQIGRQIAQALMVAHRHDIIHRDIKPQNIMVQPDGNIKVMDFGIARAKNSHLTTDNSVLGTAHYVSPEQTQGKPLGPTTDIYSLGIVMYEAATGQVPFQGDDSITVALKQVNEQPVPPSQINPAVDPSLEAIILKCMQKDPGARFQTAEELARTLTSYLSGRSVEAETAVMGAATTQMMGRPAKTEVHAPIAGTARASQTQQQSATEQAEKRERKRKRRLVAGIVCGLLALAVVIGVAVALIGGGTKSQAVPNFVNMTEEDAVAAIEEEGFFQVGSITQGYSDEVAEGRVMEQDPAFGESASEGTRINLVISQGEEPAGDVEVPDLTNMTPEQAQDELTRAGLKGAEGEAVYSDDVAEGRIARQDTAAGTTVKEGETVTYHVSRGPEPSSVPNVIGMGYQSAASALDAAGFSVSYEQGSAAPDAASAGVVYAQSPTGGSDAKAGSTVTITYYGPYVAPEPDPEPAPEPTTPSGGEEGGGATE